jgi:hypothetical protein
LLRRIIDFSIDSVGGLLSVNSIVNILKTLGYKTNVETVGMYFHFLKEAFFLHESPRYDLKGKKILQGERKFYINDLAFKYYSSSSFDFTIGAYLENAVYLHYKREGSRGSPHVNIRLTHWTRIKAWIILKSNEPCCYRDTSY